MSTNELRVTLHLIVAAVSFVREQALGHRVSHERIGSQLQNRCGGERLRRNTAHITWARGQHHSECIANGKAEHCTVAAFSRRELRVFSRLSPGFGPAANESILIIGLRDSRPSMTACALTPELLQMFQGLIAAQSSTNQIAAHGRAGASDP